MFLTGILTLKPKDTLKQNRTGIPMQNLTGISTRSMTGIPMQKLMGMTT